MAVTISAGTLSSGMVGYRVTLHTPEGDCTGILQGVHHYAETVSTGTIRDPDAEALGRKRTEIKLVGWGPYPCSPTTQVTMLS